MLICHLLPKQINYKDNKDGTVSVNYLPTAPGEYKISVRFGDKNIKGSPFFAKVNFPICFFCFPHSFQAHNNHVNVMKFNLISLSFLFFLRLASHLSPTLSRAQVTGEGRKRNQISVGSCSEVTFPGKISDADLRSLNASIQVR